MYGIQTSYGATYVGIACLMIFLTILATVLRFWARSIKRVQYSLDDWLIVGGLIFYLAEMGVHLVGPIAGGLAQHMEDTMPAELVLSWHALTHIQWIYAISFTLVRCSICVFFYRVFILTWFRRCILAVITLSISWMVFLLIYIFASCTPFAYHWDTSIPGGYCWPQYEYYYAVAGGGIIANLCIWILPQFVVWKLHMKKSHKIGIAALFALGAFDVAVECVRLVMFYRITVTTDITWGLAGIELWSFLEIGVCIILANLPLCRPVLSKLFGHTEQEPPPSTGNSRWSGKWSKSAGTDGTSSSEDEKFNTFRTAKAYCRTNAVLVERIDSADDTADQMTPKPDAEFHESGIYVHKDITVSEQRKYPEGDMV